MSDRRRVVLLRVTVAAAAILGLVSSFAVVNEFGLQTWFTEFDAFIVLYAWFFGAFVWMVAPYQPRNAVVWIMASSAIFASLVEFGGVLSLVVTDADMAIHLAEPSLIPASLPSPASGVVWATFWLWVPALLPLLTLGLLLFPDGRLPSREWRPVGYTAAVGIVVTALGSFWSYRPWNEGPAEQGPILFAGFAIVFVAAVLSAIALLGRFRRASGDSRQQIKWVLLGASGFIVVFLGFGFVLGGGPNEQVLLVPVYLAEVVFLLSYGMAVGKYRLYDIDVVVNRALVFGLLAGFITLVYALIVVGLGRLIGGEDGLALPIAATAVVAVAFEPVRQRAQRWANRVVFGRRASPYEVLSDLTKRLAVSEEGEGVLVRMANLLQDGTGAERATVWLTTGGKMHPAASWPPTGSPEGSLDLEDDHVFPVIHDGDLMGALEVVKPKGSVLTNQERSLVMDMAGSAGLILGYQRLNESLAQRAREVEASRSRLVGAQDEERRRLERELHEGAERQLAELENHIRSASQLAEQHEATELRGVLDSLALESRTAREELHSLAKGIYPSILVSEGLPAAIQGLVDGTPVEVEFSPNGVGRYPLEVEAVVYFDVSEAVTNAAKHARPPISIELNDLGGSIRFEVTDEGPGFDVDSIEHGSGLDNMQDRMDAVGGHLEIESTVGGPTRVSGEIPIPALSLQGATGD